MKTLMGSRLCEIILLSGLIVLMTIPARALSEPTHVIERPTPYGEIDWTTRVATVRGVGIPPPQSTNALQAKEMAREAAWVVAQARLLEIIKGVHINSTSTVNQLVTTNAEMRKTVDGFIRGARVVDEVVHDDGSVETTLEMKLGRAFTDTLSPTVGPHHPPTPPLDNKITHFTGLVVDATGLDVHPALKPRILDEKGREVYSVAYVDPNASSATEGIALYASDVQSAKLHRRVTKNPLFVRAVRADGPEKTDLIIKTPDAATILGVRKHFEFLKQAKVVVIVDSNR